MPAEYVFDAQEDCTWSITGYNSSMATWLKTSPTLDGDTLGPAFKLIYKGTLGMLELELPQTITLVATPKDIKKEATAIQITFQEKD